MAFLTRSLIIIEVKKKEDTRDNIICYMLLWSIHFDILEVVPLPVHNHGALWWVTLKPVGSSQKSNELVNVL